MTSESLVNLILLFFAYAFLGWCIEVTLKYFQFHRFINRGFLTGPWLPIYGSGAALITIAVKGLSPLEFSVGTTFVISFILCGVIEYLTSFFLEKRFHARWWDYSQKPMNLHGRVWIGNLVLFGLAGVAIIHIVNPVLFPALDRIPLNTRKVTAVVLLAIFAADLVISCFVLKLVKVGIDSSEADNTEEISKEVRQLLTNRSYFYSRFADAYPEVVYKTERVQARIAAVKAEAERLQQEAERRLDERKGKIAARLEPASMIRADLIGKQDALISMLYDEKTANDDMKQLKAEIDRQKNRLDHHTLARHPLGKH